MWIFPYSAASCGRKNVKFGIGQRMMSHQAAAAAGIIKYGRVMLDSSVGR